MTAAAQAETEFGLWVSAHGTPSFVNSGFKRMKREEVLFGVIGILVGLIGGYFLTNWYNESIVGQLAPNPAVASAPGNQPANPNALSPEEIAQLIKRADDDKENISFQKEVGISLYRYGAGVEDSALITEAIRLLDRVYSSTPQDRETLVALGNAHFDIGYFRRDNNSFARARKFYSEALDLQSNDADVRVDYGLTYALENPPALEKAVVEYEKSLESSPAHQRTLQMLSDALIKMGKKSEATNAVQRLKVANPSHPLIGEFEKSIAAL